MSRDDNKSYWRSPEELTEGRPLPDGESESAGLGRREFMRLAGFAVGSAAVMGCSRGVEHGVMPYLVRPEEITPGRAYWYASVCGACPAACGILAKGRDGRPIKLEGNPDHPLSRGGLCAVGQASVIGLYDSHRLRSPLRDGQTATWQDVDRAIGDALISVRRSGSKVRFLTDSVTGPAERKSIAAFLANFSDGRHVTYDPISVSAIADAHRDTHGARVLPSYHFDRAEVIVGVGADFLGGWISPVEHAVAYRAGRHLEGSGERFSRHIQIESRMTLTGSNADHRIVIPAGSAALVLAHLADEVAKRHGTRPPWRSLPACPADPATVAAVAEELREARRGKSLVVCGENDVTAQKLTNYVNHLLGNYGSSTAGTTIDVRTPSLRHRGDDAELRTLLDEIEAGQVGALFVRDVNPLYDLPAGDRLAQALSKVKLVVSFAAEPNETASRASFVCPEPHYLESWGDSEPVAGIVALRQPTVRPIGSPRPLLESLAAWSGSPATAHDRLRESWLDNVYPRRASGSSFDSFWNEALHDGFARVNAEGAVDLGGLHAFDASTVRPPTEPTATGGGDLMLELHPSAGALDGRHAHNPWLHELPDPIAKTVWDNFVAISPMTAESLEVSTGDVVRVSSSGKPDTSIEVPALVQPGQHDSSVSVALGYGRAGTDRFAKVGPQWWEGHPTVQDGKLVGVNAAPLLAWEAGSMIYAGGSVRLEKVGRRHELTTTQLHHSLDVPRKLAMGRDPRRPILQETTLATWRSDPAAGGHGHHDLPSLWPDHPKSPHHWGLAIDLTACTGCSACVIACQAENNIPVVGKDEVSRAREMHWLRIDRYYSIEDSNVDVVHMPMMCQHCDNAPCETVCPVQATVQSAEGLNQQIYNRCVGTRYCANNCPYKARRFNWFDYPREDRLQNLALNPDVTVRSRGVMEKCSLCVQRIQDAKSEAKRIGQPLQDGDIQPACAQTCPAGAIVFGDMNDPESRVAHRKHDPRHFDVLAELGIKPGVGYLTLVRNREES